MFRRWQPSIPPDTRTGAELDWRLAVPQLIWDRFARRERVLQHIVFEQPTNQPRLPL